MGGTRRGPEPVRACPAAGGQRFVQGGGGVQAGGRVARLTTQSTCGQGSWVSLWGNGKPGQTPRTGTRCPAPWSGSGDPHSVGPTATQLSLPTQTRGESGAGAGRWAYL